MRRKFIDMESSFLAFDGGRSESSSQWGSSPKAATMMQVVEQSIGALTLSKIKQLHAHMFAILQNCIREEDSNIYWLVIFVFFLFNVFVFRFILLKIKLVHLIWESRHYCLEIFHSIELKFAIIDLRYTWWSWTEIYLIELKFAIIVLEKVKRNFVPS